MSTAIENSGFLASFYVARYNLNGLVLPALTLISTSSAADAVAPKAAQERLMFQ
jgi:hypothetical protein